MSEEKHTEDNPANRVKVRPAPMDWMLVSRQTTMGSELLCSPKQMDLLPPNVLDYIKVGPPIG